MSKQLDCWELCIGHEVYLFSSHQDAISACAAMIRGAQVYSPANPSTPNVRVGLQPIEGIIRRRSVPVEVANAVSALGCDVKRLIQNSAVENKAIRQ